MLKKKMLASFVLFAVMVALSLPVFAAPNLKGSDIVIGQYWTGYDVDTAKPQSEVDEMTLEWRKKIQKDNAFKMKEIQVADWGGMLQEATISIMRGKPAAHAFILQADWAMSLYRQNLLAALPTKPLSTSTVIPYKQVAYHQEIGQIFTFNKKQYGFAVGYGTSGHDAGVFFNKRLFREAGLNPDLPYDMQKAGTWTWDEFLKICKQLTRDTRNTGRIDTWAMPQDLSTEILDLIVFSNGGEYIGRDKNGKFFNATNTPAFIESLQFARKLKDEGVMMPKPDGARWDWHIPMFVDGRVAMFFDQGYRRGEFRNLKDDWGYVLFPKGPRMKDYRFPNDENVIVIPKTYEKDVEKILHAINLWFMPVTDNWKEGMYPMFRDRRAVDETMTMIRSPRYQAFRQHIMIPGLERGKIAWEMWYFEGEPAQLVESVSQSWNELVKEANDIVVK